MPKVEDIFSPVKCCKRHFNIGPVSRIPPHSFGLTSIPKTAFTSPFGKHEYIKVPFGLTQALVYFQELMTDISKDFNFTIAYLDDHHHFQQDSRTP